MTSIPTWVFVLLIVLALPIVALVALFVISIPFSIADSAAEHKRVEARKKLKAERQKKQEEENHEAR